MPYIVLITILTFAVFCKKSGSPVKTAAISIITGGAALFFAHLICGHFGTEIPVNLFTALMSMSAGLPFVILLVLLEAEF